MTRGHRSLRAVLLGGTLLVAAYPALAAEVTSDRLINADKEPQNWLMNHRTYDLPLPSHYGNDWGSCILPCRLNSFTLGNPGSAYLRISWVR
jgi:hypothetical protein